MQIVDVFFSPNQVPLMMGQAEFDGAIFAPQFIMNPSNFDRVNSQLLTQLPMLFAGTDGEAVDEETFETVHQVFWHYVNNK